MKTSTVLLIAGGAYGVWYLSQLGSAVATVNIVLQGVTVKSLTHYVVTLTVQNISQISVDVNSMTGTVYLNGDSIANVSNFQHRTVPANGQVNIDCDINPDILGLPFVIKDIVNGQKNLNFKVEGNFNVGGMVLPFDLSKSIRL